MVQHDITRKHWVTVIHAKLGEVTFETIPGDAIVMATLRSESHEGMESLVEQGESLARQVAIQEGLYIAFEYNTILQASINSKEGCNFVIKACQSTHKPFLPLKNTMHWSEEFG